MAAIATDFTTKTPPPEVDYPTSDGKPMGETDLHRSVMVAAIETLKMHYAGQLVYVTGNILVYYRPGNRRRHGSPDAMVVRGLEQRDRENYLLWEEGREPNVVIQVTKSQDDPTPRTAVFPPVTINGVVYPSTFKHYVVEQNGVLLPLTCASHCPSLTITGLADGTYSYRMGAVVESTP